MIATLTALARAVNNQVTWELPEISRKYTLRRRADRQIETRRRIVDAAVNLHTTIGPAHTSDIAIAKRAGVTRRTFYRHFPDDVTLFRACTSHTMATWPPPDPSEWRLVTDPVERLLGALRDLYAFYRAAGPGLIVITRDAPMLRPELLPTPSRADLLRAMNPILIKGWRVRGRRRDVVQAAIAHATSVMTWQSLVVEQKLTDDEAVAVLTAMVVAAEASDKRRSG